MRFMKLAGVCVMVAVSVSMVLASASYGSPSNLGFEEALFGPSAGPMPASPASGGSLFDKEVAVLTSKGVPYPRALQAIDVQGKVAHTNIAGKVEAAMGSTSGGTWFEPATAQLHVGVTSAASRRVAEGVITREGLITNVVVTPVRSTMEELLVVQKQWNRKLASLFARNQVKTGIEPQQNAVSVILGSLVPSSERAALRRKASVAKVNVFVTVAPSTHLAPTPVANECNNFPPANCEPSITAGAEIQGKLKCEKVAEMLGPQFFKTENECLKNENGGKGEWERKHPICTAGPAAIPEANRGERVLLTAGHCIEGGGGNNIEWFAFKRNLEEPLIGKSITFENGGIEGEGKGDFGDIKIEPGGGWQTGNANNPVLAVTAEWKKVEKTRYPVKGERRAEVGNTNCHEGRTSGEQCGEVTLVNLTYNDGSVKEGMIEDRKAINEPGDSGGPWLFEPTENNPNHEVLIEGTNAAVRVTCKKLEVVKKGPEFFENEAECIKRENMLVGKEGVWERKIESGWQPLRTAPLKIPKGSLEKLNLELLTTANEVIPVAHEFKVEGKTIASGSKVEVQGQGVVLGQLEGEIAKTNIHISCNDAKGPAGGSNALKAGGESKLKSEFFACTLYGVAGGKPENLPGCKIQSGGVVGQINAEANGALNQSTGEAGTITFTGAGATETLSTFEIAEATEKASPKCSITPLTVAVKGKQVCGIPHYGFESDIGGLICDGSGSKSLEMGKSGGSEFKNAKIYEALTVAGTKGQKLGVT